MRQLWAKIVLILTLKCDQASLLHSDAMDRRLQWSERLALQGHFLVCRVCRKLKSQLGLLSSANEHSTKEVVEIDQCSLPPEAAARIEQKLQEASSRNNG